MKVPQSPIYELSRQSEDQGPKAVRCGVIRSCDVLVETQTLNHGCIPADTADRCSAAPLQRQHNPTKRLRLSKEVKRRLLDLSVGSILPKPVRNTFDYHKIVDCSGVCIIKHTSTCHPSIKCRPSLQCNLKFGREKVTEMPPFFNKCSHISF